MMGNPPGLLQRLPQGRVGRVRKAAHVKGGRRAPPAGVSWECRAGRACRGTASQEVGNKEGEQRQEVEEGPVSRRQKSKERR